MSFIISVMFISHDTVFFYNKTARLISHGNDQTNMVLRSVSLLKFISRQHGDRNFRRFCTNKQGLSRVRGKQCAAAAQACAESEAGRGCACGRCGHPCGWQGPWPRGARHVTAVLQNQDGAAVLPSSARRKKGRGAVSEAVERGSGACGRWHRRSICGTNSLVFCRGIDQYASN